MVFRQGQQLHGQNAGLWQRSGWANKYTQARNKRVQARSRTGVTGVIPGNSGYVATLRYNGHLNYLGTFSTVEEAQAARKASEEKYWKDGDTS